MANALTKPADDVRAARTPKVLKKASDDPRGFALVGYGIIIFCFVVLGGWAAVTPLGARWSHLA